MTGIISIRYKLHAKLMIALFVIYLFVFDIDFPSSSNGVRDEEQSVDLLQLLQIIKDVGQINKT